jgi:4'-phosphopantetheinyl transferase
MTDRDAAPFGRIAILGAGPVAIRVVHAVRELASEDGGALCTIALHDDRTRRRARARDGAHAGALASGARRASDRMTGVTWVIQGRAAVPDSLAWLAGEERARLDRLRIAKRRDDFLLGRWTAKCAIATRVVPAPPFAAIAIRAAGDGAPEAWLEGAPLPLTLSLSHSAGRALAGVRDAGTVLGVDLECVEPRSALLVGEFFTADEAARVAAASPDRRDHAITLIWSAKESVLKARRSGLREDPRRVGIMLGERGEPLAAGATDDACGAWQAFAVAIDGEASALVGWWRDDAGHVLTMVGDALATPQ